jgi:hypothetical protein
LEISPFEIITLKIEPARSGRAVDTSEGIAPPLQEAT